MRKVSGLMFRVNKSIWLWSSIVKFFIAYPDREGVDDRFLPLVVSFWRKKKGWLASAYNYIRSWYTFQFEVLCLACFLGQITWSYHFHKERLDHIVKIMGRLIPSVRGCGPLGANRLEWICGSNSSGHGLYQRFTSTERERDNNPMTKMVGRLEKHCGEETWKIKRNMMTGKRLKRNCPLQANGRV